MNNSFAKKLIKAKGNNSLTLNVDSGNNIIQITSWANSP